MCTLGPVPAQMHLHSASLLAYLCNPPNNNKTNLSWMDYKLESALVWVWAEVKNLRFVLVDFLHKECLPMARARGLDPDSDVQIHTRACVRACACVAK